MAQWRAELQRLAGELQQVGFTTAGSLVRRYTHCTSEGCRCNAEPPRLHGPYWQWSQAVNGKAVSRRLLNEEVALYQEWITNRRRLRSLVVQMKAVSAQATQLLLAQTNGHPSD
ncbi:MAG: DUF6788 family protein [Acidimicrobiales bacterium]